MFYSLDYRVYQLSVTKSLKKHEHLNANKVSSTGLGHQSKEWLILLESRDLKQFKKQRLKLCYLGVSVKRHFR